MDQQQTHTKGDTPMTEIQVTVVSPEEADDGIAEFWCGPELLGITTSRTADCICESSRAPIASRG